MNKLPYRSITAGVVLFLSLSSPTFAAGSNKLPIEETRKFVEILETIRASYVDKVTDEQLFGHAIRGMLSGLDPHSGYLDQQQSNDLQIRTQGQFGGLGIHIVMDKSGVVRVVSPIDDTPAFHAGIQSNDLIVELDGDQVQGMTLEQALQRMRGKPGTPIVLTIIREGEAQPLQFKIIRDIIKMKSVRYEALGRSIGYIRISNFQAATDDEFQDAINALRQAGDLNGFVLDLRNNPGGRLDAAIKVSDTMLKKNKMVVFTKGRTASSKRDFYSQRDDLTNGIPLVVLVNGGSASASEIVAGALLDHKRAVIMGTQTFGKGSVQSVISLPAQQAAIKLTTALYYTPNGISIQAKGITPDIQVDLAKIEKIHQGLTFKEADLAGHLDNGNAVSDEQAATNLATSSQKKTINDLLKEDYQVQEAFNLLVGLNILKQQ